jgi:hypothetical protein
VDGAEVLHLLHGPGMTLGEPGYFSVERVRRVVDMAVSAAVVIRLDRRDFSAFMRAHPSATGRALEGLAAMCAGRAACSCRARRTRCRTVSCCMPDLLDLKCRERPGQGCDTTRLAEHARQHDGRQPREREPAFAGLLLGGAIRREGSRYVLVVPRNCSRHESRVGTSCTSCTGPRRFRRARPATSTRWWC